ncbi:MAG: sulfur oxidation c-type cytochrome SoxA, partial [Pseudomonadota bacterium]|nr:sulfur oxidation c-type cytochrome SoxA [Pseudomonadota bacterium]
MKNLPGKLLLLSVVAAVAVTAQAASEKATPERDKEVFDNRFKERFPDVVKEEYANGVYAIDP